MSQRLFAAHGARLSEWIENDDDDDGNVEFDDNAEVETHIIVEIDASEDINISERIEKKLMIKKVNHFFLNGVQTKLFIQYGLILCTAKLIWGEIFTPG